MSEDLPILFDRQLGAHESIRELAWLNGERADVLGERWRGLGSNAWFLKYHLQHAVTLFASRAIDEHHQMWRQRTGWYLGRHLRKVDTRQIETCGGPRHLAHREVINEECSNDVHERRTLPLEVVATQPTLSEHESKQVLSAFGVTFAPEAIVSDAREALVAAEQIGYPVVLKLVGERLAHKSERGLVRIGLNNGVAVEQAANDLLRQRRDDDGNVALLVAKQVTGSRELLVGMVRDALFGAVIVIGVGGVNAEAFGDVQMRVAPLTADDLDDMLDSLATRELFGAFRGQQPLQRGALWRIVDAVAQAALQRSDIASIDINPVIVMATGEPVAVDALIELGTDTPPGNGNNFTPDDVAEFPRHDDAGFEALFNPRGVVVLGASTHPGKFGFVSLHNLLASGYRGRVAATNLSGEVVLGVQTIGSLSELAHGEYDMAFFCTPASVNERLLQECAERGIRAAFVTSAGYGESDGAGQAAETRLVAAARDANVLLAGPNGQGVVSTPSSLCAQIVAPYPPPGSISIASQSGNFVTSFMNLARASGVGVARAVSAGNAAAVDVADYIEWLSRDSATATVLSYIEGVTDGRRLRTALELAVARKPVVLVKGGASAAGARAASSHTGAMASDDNVFGGLCRQLGIVRALDVDEAFDSAAFFATSSLPRGNRVAILTTAGGWGVVTADALSRDATLQLAELPDDVMNQLDELLVARWSRNNPVDCAGGETRDTIPAVLAVLANSAGVDAVVYLGIGIQANQARLMREGAFHPDHGLARIVDYHERQDERFATAAHDLALATGKPILVATELAVADPTNAGPRTVRALGGMCYASGPRAVRALGHAYRYAHHRGLAQ